MVFQEVFSLLSGVSYEERLQLCAKVSQVWSGSCWSFLLYAVFLVWRLCRKLLPQMLLIFLIGFWMIPVCSVRRWLGVSFPLLMVLVIGGIWYGLIPSLRLNLTSFGSCFILGYHLKTMSSLGDCICVLCVSCVDSKRKSFLAYFLNVLLLYTFSIGCRKFSGIAAATYSLWMIWKVRNYARFQQCISLDTVIHTIKGNIRLSRTAYKNYMNNDMTHFSILKVAKGMRLMVVSLGVAVVSIMGATLLFGCSQFLICWNHGSHSSHWAFLGCWV